MALVELQSVTRHFGEASVLAGVDMLVEAGESIAILGPSGAGKSTLLNLIGGLDEPSSGSVNACGMNLGTLDADALADYRNQKVGFVFQSHHLLPQLTAIENVMLPTLAATGHAPTGAKEKAGSLLQDVGLGERMSHRPGQMSGGERQRVALVRALIGDPELVLADEPTGSLDENSSAQVADLLASMIERHGKTLITVTHSVALAARMNRTLHLHDGVIGSSPSRS